MIGIIAIPLMLSGAIGLARADDNIPYSTVPMTTILKNLKDNGYIAIQKVKYKDGYYQAKAVNQHQQYVKLRISPQTGEVVNKEASSTQNKISMLEASKRVLAEGYSHIYKIEIDGSHYEVKAIDKHQKQVELTVDANSGKVSKDWF